MVFSWSHWWEVFFYILQSFHLLQLYLCSLNIQNEVYDFRSGQTPICYQYSYLIFIEYMGFTRSSVNMEFQNHLVFNTSMCFVLSSKGPSCRRMWALALRWLGHHRPHRCWLLHVSFVFVFTTILYKTGTRAMFGKKIDWSRLLSSTLQTGSNSN